MPLIDRDSAFEFFKERGTNSSHFVWFLADLEFYLTAGGWLFAIRIDKRCLLFALEPMVPGGLRPETDRYWIEFQEAWNEICSAFPNQDRCFVGVYEGFAKVLEKSGFSIVQIGEEPWIDLTHCVPHGNASKGVRSARNQAIRSGLQIEEWSGSQILESTEKSSVLLQLVTRWKDRRLLQLPGFLNTVDPLHRAELKRHFIAKDSCGKVRGYQVATPVPARQSYFLEDLMLDIAAPRGCGELLTLGTMTALRDSGYREASLGVVSARSVQLSQRSKLPPVVELLLVQLPTLLKRVYNLDGMETFRKRFKPTRWEGIYFCVEGSRSAPTHLWLRALTTLFWAFEPRLSLSVTWTRNALIRPLTRYPMTVSVGLASAVLFAFINHGGQLPQWALDRFGFTGSAPIVEWPLRSIVSDYLYFDRAHFLFWGIAYLFVIQWAERSHPRKFLIPFFLLLSLFDDFINYLCIIQPIEYLKPALFEKLIAHKDVGGSLGLATFLGMQLCQLRHNREIAFALIATGLVFGFVFTELDIQSLLIDLNHFLFLSFGYIVGKFRFEKIRRKNESASRGKTPKSSHA